MLYYKPIQMHITNIIAPLTILSFEVLFRTYIWLIILIKWWQNLFQKGKLQEKTESIFVVRNIFIKGIDYLQVLFFYY